MRVSLLALPLLGGCAQIAGIDKTNADNRAVSLVYDRLSIGAKVSTAPLALDGLTASFLVPSDDDPDVLVAVPADPISDGLWSAKIKSGTPPALFTLPDGASYLYELPSRTMHGRFVALEHPGATPEASATAQVSVDLTLEVAAAVGDSYQLLEVGTWVQQTLTAADAATTITQTFPYADTVNLAAPLPRAAITADDAIVLSHYAAGELQATVDVTPAGPQGATTTVTGTLAPVTKNQMVSMAVDATAGSRFAMVKPGGTGAVASSYTLTAAPGFAQGVTAGPLLKQKALLATDTAVTATFANPFATTRMWPSALVYAATQARTYTIGGMMGAVVPLSAGLTEVIAPDTATALSFAVAMPLVITVGITPLQTDGTSVLIDNTKPVPVSFTTDGMPASVYQLELIELTATGTKLTETRRLVMLGDTPSFAVPGSLLLPSHNYKLRASAVNGGFADPATGDVSTVTPPFSSGYLDGGVFTVTL